MTEDQKQALIKRIEELQEEQSSHWTGHYPGNELDQEIWKIALAALTAAPVEYRLLNESGEVMAHRDTLHEAELCIASWNKNWKVQPLFTRAAPAVSLANWIECSERLPQDREQVILWDSDIGEHTSGHYSQQTGKFYSTGMIIDNEITHWLPAPAAPEVE